MWRSEMNVYGFSEKLTFKKIVHLNKKIIYKFNLKSQVFLSKGKSPSLEKPQCSDLWSKCPDGFFKI